MPHFSDNFLVPNFDLAVQGWGPAAASPASIPTVSEWGLSCAVGHSGNVGAGGDAAADMMWQGNSLWTGEFG